VGGPCCPHRRRTPPRARAAQARAARAEVKVRAGRWAAAALATRATVEL